MLQLSFRQTLLATALICSLPAAAAPAGDLPLMPWPQDVSIQNGRFNIDNKLKIEVSGDKMYESIPRWRQRIEAQTGWLLAPQKANDDAQIQIVIANAVDPIPQPNIDESYTLTIGKQGVVIKADNRFGAMRGMETLLQLLKTDDQGTYFPLVTIKDKPRFAWRGVLLDSARHFIPVGDLKRQLDGMAAAKMNVFHWHLTDDQGWRFASDKYPKLQELASDGLFYTKQEMQDIVNYATKLGIRVVPEIDLPGHASALAVAYPELISAQPKDHYSMQRDWGVHKPTLDPSNPDAYIFVDELIKELTEIFPDPYLHIGGDEVDPTQWNESPTIQAFMKQQDLKDAHALQAYFNQRLETILTKHQRKMVGWDEIYHPSLPRSIIIHSWQGQDALGVVAQDGYQGILSTGFYIDQPHSTAYHYRNELQPRPLAVNEKPAVGESAQSWEFTMPRLKGSPVKGTFTLIEGPSGWRGFIDFAGKSRRAVNDIHWSDSESVAFTVDTWMGETSPVLKLKPGSKQLSGYILVGNVRYPVTGSLLDAIPQGIPGTVPDANHRDNILGGEAALWAENVNAEVLDIKLWPRTFAIAERLWSANDVTDAENMYQRLDAMDTWSVVSVGLQQHANSARMMTRLANSTQIESLQILAEAVESAQYYTRNHAKFQAGNYNQFEPLNRFADTLGPESLTVKEMDGLVSRLLANKDDTEAYDALRLRLERWRNNSEPLMLIVNANYTMKNLRPVAQDVGDISILGLQLLEALRTGQKLSDEQTQTAQALLDRGAELRDEVVIRAVYPLARLLDAVGSKQ